MHERDLQMQTFTHLRIIQKVFLMALKYYEQIDRDNTKKLRELLDELPYFCTMYFRGIETTTSSRTRIAYARDLKIFF